MKIAKSDGGETHPAGSAASRSAECRFENVCFSNRPVGVKRFQAIHGCSVDVTRGLVLLYGIGT